MPPSRTAAAESSTELGSFRDPDSRVFLDDDVVYRVLSPDGWQDWLALAATPLVADDRLIPTEPVELDELPDLTAGPAAGALRHEKVPFVSYPYEWPFSMLKDAALLQLELGRRALQHDLTLKDASRLQRPVPRREPGVRRRRLLRAAQRGRAMGRLSPVLHALPLSADAAGLPGHALPRAPARLARRHHAGRGAGAAVRPPPRGAHPRRPARPAGGPLRRRRRPRGQARPQARGLRQGAARREPAQAREARPPARVQARPHGLDRVRAHEHLQRRGGGPQGRVRPRRRRPAQGPRLGPRLQRRHVLARGRRARRHRRGASTPTTRRSTASTGRCATRAAQTSCRW